MSASVLQGQTGEDRICQNSESTNDYELEREINEHARQLAEWTVERIVNRRDCWGGYFRTDDGVIHRTTRKAEKRGKPLDSNDIYQHFLFNGRRSIVGLHAIVREPSGKCFSRFLVIDFDCHGSKDDPHANERCAKAKFEQARALGFTPILTESDGRGGYHLMLVFDKPTRTSKVYAIARWLIRDWKAFGVASEPETFPKQRSIGEGKYGNWIRLFGIHPKTNHLTGVWDGSRWLRGAEAARYIVAIRGTSAENLPTEVTRYREPGKGPRKTKEATKRAVKRFDDSGDVELARSALAALPFDRIDNYKKWVELGMTLCGLGTAGLELWIDCSAKCQKKFDRAECEAKWKTFTPGGGLGLGSLFEWAKEAGWQYPKRPARESTHVAVVAGRENGPVMPSDESSGRDGESGDHPVPEGQEANPRRLARIVLREKFQDHLFRRTLRHIGKDFWGWRDGRHEIVVREDLRALVHGVIEDEFVRLYNLALSLRSP